MATNSPADTIKDTADATADQADRVIDRAAQAAHDTVDRVAGTVQQRAEQFSSLQEEWCASSRDCVRDNPLASVAVAFGAGILFSKLFLR